MPADRDQRPVIILKKKSRGGHGHHGGAWKVAYADFVTAMMALFLMLWLVAQSPKTKSKVGAYFRDPLGLAGGGNTELNTGPSSGGAGFFGGGNTAIALDTEFSPGRASGDSTSRERSMLNLSNARNRLAQALMALRMDSWARHVELTAVEAGLRIEVQDSTDGQLFLRGGARLNPAARPTMAAIAEELGILPNSLVIEGHTDAMPYSRNGGLYTNWEVSTDRANTARRFLVEHGVRPEQVVEVRGYADRRLRIWHDPYNPRNRRISILVLLERRQPTAAPAPDAQSPAHPLLERLNQLEYAAQGPGRTAIELQPNGKAYPGTSAQEAPRAPAGEGSRAVLDPHAASTESPLESE